MTKDWVGTPDTSMHTHEARKHSTWSPENTPPHPQAGGTCYLVTNKDYFPSPQVMDRVYKNKGCPADANQEAERAFQVLEAQPEAFLD